MATSSFKNQRTPRVVASDVSYALGMKYTNKPIEDGYCHTLVNYDYTSNADAIKPRGGYKVQEVLTLGTTGTDYITHHKADAYLEDVDADDAYTIRYVLAGKQVGATLDITDAKIFIDDTINEQWITATLNPSYAGAAFLKLVDNSGWGAMHGMIVTNPESFGIAATVDGYTYVNYVENSVDKLGKLRIYYESSEYHFDLIEVTPDEITPLEAVNYGYNMLDDDPYNFENVENTVGVIQLLGVLPYDPTTDEIKFNANVGESVKFELNYSYPPTDVTGAKQYAVQWEIKDLDQTNADATVIQKVADSPVYDPGDTITKTFLSPFKRFTVIVKVYYSSDLTTLLQAIQLPSYYLSDDNKTAVFGITPRNFDITTATGLVEWNGRLVVWGVAGAETTLFSSEPNNPAYFPYPHYTDVFTEPIVNVIPYLGDLMVFTTSKIIRVTLDEDYNFMIHEVVQENLYLSKYDATTITLVKNMLYFKSNNYYYMIVPKVDSTGVVNGVKLAPISKSIEYLLDTFESSITDIITTIYELDLILGGSEDPYHFDLYFYYNYLDSDQVKNVYKIKIYRTGDEANAKFLDLSLNYDTLLRNWKIYIVETNNNRIIPYRLYVTDNTQFINIFDDGTAAKVQLLQQDSLDPKDEHNLDGGNAIVFEADQYIDTGFRQHNNIYKKRYREVDFYINNTSKVDLNFYSAFYVDSLQRKGFYKYETKQITDPIDPSYGILYVERSLVEPELVRGVTALGYWALGLSQFPKLALLKVRIRIGNAKGYAGRFQLLSKNAVTYELTNHNWVFRTMNAR